MSQLAFNNGLAYNTTFAYSEITRDPPVWDIKPDKNDWKQDDYWQILVLDAPVFLRRNYFHDSLMWIVSQYSVTDKHIISAIAVLATRITCLTSHYWWWFLWFHWIYIYTYLIILIRYLCVTFPFTSHIGLTFNFCFKCCCLLPFIFCTQLSALYNLACTTLISIFSHSILCTF